MKTQSYDAEYCQRNEARIKANSAITAARNKDGIGVSRAIKPETPSLFHVKGKHFHYSR